MKLVAQETRKKSFKILIAKKRKFKYPRMFVYRLFWRISSVFIGDRDPTYRILPNTTKEKRYGCYSLLSQSIYLNLDTMKRELPVTVVYIITHEFLHHWVYKNVGARASFALDVFAKRSHFPMTETEPVLVPVLWGGRHHRSLWELIWAFIAINTWKAKQEPKVMPVESGRRTIRRL